MHSRNLALVTLIALCVGLVPFAGADEAATPVGTSELSGKVTDADGKSLVGAVVLAYHLSSEAVFDSDPTGSNGNYTILALPYGYYDLAVQTTDGLFVANQVVNVPPKGRTVASFVLGSAGAAADPSAGQPRSFPGIDADPTGIASVNEKLTGRDFWRSKKGVAIIAGSGAAALLLLANSDSSSRSTTSPTSP